MQRDSKHLLNQLASGNEGVFREIFDQYAPKIYSFALKLTHSVVTAEEIVQDVFLKIWTHRDHLTGVNHFSAYLYTLTRNHIFTVLKQQSREMQAKTRLLQEQSRLRETEVSANDLEYQNLLDHAMTHLSPQQKLVFDLCRLKGFKYTEAAKRLNISPLTVKTHMQQALRALKLHLGGILTLFVGNIFF